MSIPLDQLYNFLDNISGHDLLIYHWYPHGSKNVEQLTSLKDYASRKMLYQLTTPIMICHDQEPVELSERQDEFLNFCVNRLKNIWDKEKMAPAFGSTVVDFLKTRAHFREITPSPNNCYDYVLLLHSELNSNYLTQHQNQYKYISVYYWSHALIARDWFRYAELDPKLASPKEYTHDFLIYNRAWTGTREYRLKFAELLVNSNLYQNCKMGFSINDNMLDYREHKFKNQDFQISNHNIQDYFFDNQTPSTASADYSSIDYQSCGIEIVLETLFDDKRIHLTEKILKPIACGHPFILIGSPGSLEYLRSYGFKTFSGLINEDYDQIQNPVRRLDAIVNLMKDITSMSENDKINLFQQMSCVAKQNQEIFFSDNFQNYIIQEFKTNLDNAMIIMNQNRTGKYFREKIKFIAGEGRRLWPSPISRQECAAVWQWIKRHN